ncbi:hypothetical protein Ga0123462_0680 [Mariprofundus ferrinatatus]|uniref:Pyridoxal phosphate homeostasis protein n=1 Tax=Mariprofundus ferrinatatus TaxID=1921087 RepID=A0A2K8L2J2_9PROT|nr:YggS family pyridoxal phosphate-dependent enzyme [Mariprofundus ferrinatatus]ATX81550.1 hypothetical protein Ga0123462_0680 [Mariprofundus ferrinatatus]
MDPHQEMVSRWQALKSELDQVKLLAVSKYTPDEMVQVLIDAGETEFGESRPQSLRDRAEKWPQCNWHMIGPLQKNKAKYIGRHAAMWHSCDDIATAEAVARSVEGRVLPVLIQVNIAGNPNQRGVAPDKVAAFAHDLSQIEGLKLAGLMGMGPQGEGVRDAFRQLRSLRDNLFGGSFGELCMGMSNDYRIAVEEGATIVRLGSMLFGSR